MDEITEVKHNIQKNILSFLKSHKIARFRDMRPPRIDTNLYSYHVTQLQKHRYIKKVDDGYTLDWAGLIYVDRLDENGALQKRVPKNFVMLVIQNSDGDVLLQRQSVQPYIESWTLPGREFTVGDMGLSNVANEVAKDIVGVLDQDVIYAGTCRVSVHRGDCNMTSSIVQVFTVNSDVMYVSKDLLWARPHKLHTMDLAPGTSEIIARTFFRDPYFFEEYSIDWKSLFS